MTVGAGGGRFGEGISRSRSNSKRLCGVRSRLSSFDAMERMCPASRPLTRSTICRQPCSAAWVVGELRAMPGELVGQRQFDAAVIHVVSTKTEGSVVAMDPPCLGSSSMGTRPHIRRTLGASDWPCTSRLSPSMTSEVQGPFAWPTFSPTLSWSAAERNSLGLS
jgi:hypothetical protein